MAGMNNNPDHPAAGKSAPAKPLSADQEKMHEEICRMLKNGPVVVNLKPGVTIPGVSFPVGPDTRYPPGSQFVNQSVLVNAGGSSSGSNTAPFDRSAHPWFSFGRAQTPVPADLAGKPKPNTKIPSSSDPPPAVKKGSSGEDSDSDESDGHFPG